MKKLTKITAVRAATAGLLAFSMQGAFAHDPAEHAKEAAAAKAGPDCVAMNKMDMSKMDMKDPVMQAMMKKCMSTGDKGKSMEMQHDGHDMKGMSMDHGNGDMKSMPIDKKAPAKSSADAKPAGMPMKTDDHGGY